MIFKNFADQDWIGLILMYQDWTPTKNLTVCSSLPCGADHSDLLVTGTI